MTQKGRVSRYFAGLGGFAPCAYRPRLLGGGGEVVEPGWLGQLERAPGSGAGPG